MVEAAVVMPLEFAVSISYFVDVLSAVVDASMDALMAVMIRLVLDIGVGVLADATGTFFTSLMTASENAVPKPLEEFDC